VNIYRQARSLFHRIVSDDDQQHYLYECSQDLLLHQILGLKIFLTVPSRFRMYLWASQMIMFGSFLHRRVQFLPSHFPRFACIRYHIHFMIVSFILFP
jgi:hypothetical protein